MCIGYFSKNFVKTVKVNAGCQKDAQMSSRNKYGEVEA